MNVSEVDQLRSQAYRKEVDEVITALETDVQSGLNDAEANKRLSLFGANQLVAAESVPAWKKFLAQFTDTLVVLLLVATVISAALWFYQRSSALPYEAIAIFGVVLLNAILGFVQETRAEKAVTALRAMSAADARVVRDGQPCTVPATNLVPGDIILLEEGDTIPADARVIQSVAMNVAESALTGESIPVEKGPAPLTEEVGLGDRNNMLFSGTAVTYGRGRAVVVGTGMQTEMGHIAGMLESTEDVRTPLQIELDTVGRLLGIIVVVIAIVMIAMILIVEDVHGFSAYFDVMILGVALAVAAVPEGLPAVVTAVLSLGVQRMAKRKAIVRHLAAVETLGSADIIASDKTGTLTKNEMTVRTVVTASGRAEFSGHGYSPEGKMTIQAEAPLNGQVRLELERALRVADQACNAMLIEEEGRWQIQGDPTEGALLVAARKVGLVHDELEEEIPRIGEVPFSSERKLMSTIHSHSQLADQLMVFTKGAPDVLLARCSSESIGDEPRPLTPQRRGEWITHNEGLANSALRTLGVAVRLIPANSIDVAKAGAGIEEDLVFLGLIGMLDPPRDEAKEAVAEANAAGIRVMMITGDHPRTAAVIASELGISPDGKAITGAELQEMSDEELRKTIVDVSVYARVNPEHKLRIVEALQSRGATVAMTGDGVNDAPALKSANIGIAMGITGTDVSKEAADIVLTDDNFATIVAAVEEGRAIFDNIRKFLRYLLSSNIGEVLTMFFGVLFSGMIGLEASGEAVVLPLLATQILWINLVTDGPPALALGVDPAALGLMRRRPRPSHEGVITSSMWIGIAFVGVIMAIGALGVLDASLPGGFIEGSGSLAYGQTMAFTTLVLFQLFNVFNARSDEESAFRGLFNNGWLWAAVLFSLFLHGLVIYVPFLQEAFSTVSLSLRDWLVCAGVASSVVWLRELTKMVTRWRRPAVADPA